MKNLKWDSSDTDAHQGTSMVFHRRNIRSWKNTWWTRQLSKQTNKQTRQNGNTLAFCYTAIACCFKLCCIPNHQREKLTDPSFPFFSDFRTGLLSCSGMGLHTSVYTTVCSKSASRGAYRERRQGGIGYLLVCSRPETYELIISKNKGTHVKRVHIYTASTVREANWQLYLHVCSLGEDHQPGSCRSLADLHTHTLCQHHSHRKGEERKENWI